MAGSNKENRFLNFFVVNSKKILIGLMVFVVITLAAGALTFYTYQKETKDTLAVVEGEKITITYYKKLSYAILRNGTPEDPVYPDDDEIKGRILDTAIEKILVHNRAVELGLTASDNDALEALKKKDPNYNQRVVGANDILDYEKFLVEKEKITENVGGNKSGSIIIAREDVYYPENGVLTSELENKIKNNATYSKSFIDDIYSKLSNNSITVSEAVRTENENSVIGKNANPLVQTFHSTAFTVDDYRDRVGLLVHPEIVNEINQLGAGKISAPKEIVSSEAVVGEHKKIAWFLVVLDESSSKSGQTYVEWIASEKDRIGVIIYGDVNERV